MMGAREDRHTPAPMILILSEREASVAEPMIAICKPPAFERLSSIEGRKGRERERG